MKIKVLVVDDHQNVRIGLRKMLNHSPAVEVVGEAGNGEEALQLAQELEPDVLLLDVEMPGMNGYEVARRITNSGQTSRVLALSGHNEKRNILGMFASGAVGYITKDEAPEQLLTAIVEVAAGKRGWISQNVAKIIGVPAQSVGRNTIPALSSKEKAVLNLIIAGKSDAEILRLMEMDPPDLKSKIEAINMKLGAKSRLEAIVRAMQEDIL